MRYSLRNGIVIKTENAAKPASQASKALSDYISCLDHVDSSFDYGCGKLRYLKTIAETTHTLTAVDSEIQIARMQAIDGEVTSVRDIARRSNCMAAVNVMEFSADRKEFDRGFCVNVLSAIPFHSVRRSVLNIIRQKLRPGGTCLFVVQYRNSDFKRMSKLPNARPWRDGFLIDSLRGFSFYGLISPQRLSALVVDAGFEIVDQYLDDGRIFLMASSPRKPLTEVEVLSETSFRFRVNQSATGNPSPAIVRPIDAPAVLLDRSVTSVTSPRYALGDLH
jgi:SAM-dependent methyltransferase